MKYLKVMFSNKSNANGTGFEYKIDEVNIAKKWNPKADNPEEMGGFNFSVEDKIIRWLVRGDTIYDVEIPDDAEMIEINHPATPGGVFRSNKIIVSNPRKVTDEMAMEFYKKSTIPEKTYFKAIAGCAIRGHINTAMQMIKDKVDSKNIDVALDEFKDFCTNREIGVFDENKLGKNTKKVYDILNKVGKGKNDMEDKNVEKKQDKKIKIFGLVSLGIILILIASIVIINATTTREEKILKYLEDKYNEYFEVVRLISSGEKVLIHELGMDGGVLIPEVKSKSTICYLYEIRAYKDDLLFELMYEDKRIYDEIYEAYFRLSRGDKFLNEIAEYIVFELGDKDSKVEFSKYEYKDYGMEGEITIEVNQNLNDKMSADYIENKLRKISSYIKKKVKEQENVTIEVNVNFNNGMRLWFNDLNVVPLISVIPEDEYQNVDFYTPYEYLQSLQTN